MELFVKIEKGRYVDSLETLFSSTVFNEQPGIETGNIGMATDAFKDVNKELGLLTPEIATLSEGDYVIVAKAESKEAFEAAIAATEAVVKQSASKQSEVSFGSVADAVRYNPRANLCQISVPGEYALEEVKKALDAGLHCCVFSNNVPLADEREMKELALSKGLLCMGPDCGVANINGAALVLSSINARGPFGIVGASGCGIQHVAAILHEAGSGVSQTIGTGGNDLKAEVGGLMMLAGIDVLEADLETKYIVLIARKSADNVKPKLLERSKACRKPCVVFFMDCTREQIESLGAIYAANLDDCAEQCLKLVGKSCRFETDEELWAMAKEAVAGMNAAQKYVRGAFSGGTYMDEAMHTMEPLIGDIYSNAPLREELRLADSYVSKANTCIDYGEEEFTLGRPHPAIDASIRRPAILREAADPETAVILLDFILTPPGHPDPAGYVAGDILAAKAMAKRRNGDLAVVASVLGTTADFQNIDEQRKKLRDAGVYCVSTNCRAAKLAGMIVKLKKEKDA
ncbi:MAG: FdrA family protein [Clostridia bacterium]|nr:FdrA family protein [Clostridia bacterium]